MYNRELGEVLHLSWTARPSDQRLTDDNTCASPDHDKQWRRAAKRMLFPRMSMDFAASMPFLILLLKNLQLVTLLQVGLTK